MIRTTILSSFLIVIMMAMHAPDSVVVTATVYQAKEEQCNSDPFTTAFDYRIDPCDPLKHRYIAISKDLESIFHPGDSVLIKGTYPYNDSTLSAIYDGVWLVADRMHPRWVKKIDLLVGDDSFIDSFTDVTVINLN